MPYQKNGMAFKYYIPSKISKDAKAKIRRMVENVLGELKISNGPVYFRIKIKEDKPKIIEITPRLDGCHL